MQPLVVKKDFTVLQNFLLDIIPSFLASFERIFFAFLVKNYICF